jgi:mRNA-degrading endonuclease RelE of RelBE toxin-antitoxin system
MKYDVRTLPPFERQLKRLAKKFPTLKTEFAELIRHLRQGIAGTALACQRMIF